MRAGIAVGVRTPVGRDERRQYTARIQSFLWEDSLHLKTKFLSWRSPHLNSET